MSKQLAQGCLLPNGIVARPGNRNPRVRIRSALTIKPLSHTYVPSRCWQSFGTTPSHMSGSEACSIGPSDCSAVSTCMPRPWPDNG